MLTPRLESVIAEKKGEVVLAKVDIDENTDLALDYEVIITAVALQLKIYSLLF
jgi:thioredoxin 1